MITLYVQTLIGTDGMLAIRHQSSLKLEHMQASKVVLDHLCVIQDEVPNSNLHGN